LYLENKNKGKKNNKAGTRRRRAFYGLPRKLRKCPADKVFTVSGAPATGGWWRNKLGGKGEKTSNRDEMSIKRRESTQGPCQLVEATSRKRVKSRFCHEAGMGRNRKKRAVARAIVDAKKESKQSNGRRAQYSKESAKRGPASHASRSPAQKWCRVKNTPGSAERNRISRTDKGPPRLATSNQKMVQGGEEHSVSRRRPRR